jgi:hypothetical protein
MAFQSLGTCIYVFFWLFRCCNITSSNFSSAFPFSLALFALDAKSNYAFLGEGLKFISDSKDSVGVFL